MVRNLLILNLDTDLQIFRFGLPIALSALAVGDKEVAFGSPKYLTPDIDSREIGRVILSTYSAGTQQAVTVTQPAVAPNLVEGFSVGLIKTTIGTANTPRKVFYDPTVAGLATKINAEGANANSFFFGWVATASAQVLTVTAPVKNTFRAYSPSSGVVAYTVAMVLPVGRPADVLELENYCTPYEGATNKVGFPVMFNSSRVLSGAQYDMITTEVYPVASRKDFVGRKVEDIRIYFAVNKAIVTATKTATDILAALVKLT